jgi:hypothetical protein
MIEPLRNSYRYILHPYLKHVSQKKHILWTLCVDLPTCPIPSCIYIYNSLYIYTVYIYTYISIPHILSTVYVVSAHFPTSNPPTSPFSRLHVALHLLPGSQEVGANVGHILHLSPVKGGSLCGWQREPRGPPEVVMSQSLIFTLSLAHYWVITWYMI